MAQREGLQMVQDVERIHKTVRKLASKSNHRAGARVIYFKFKRSTNLGEPSSGKMILIGEKEDDGNFFIYPSDSIRQIHNIADLSLRLRTPFLLPVKVLSSRYGPPGSQEELVLGYDHFDDMFSRWIHRNHQEPFSAEEEPLNEYWRKQIGNLLCTLSYMHERKAFHGNMSEDSSYVVIDSNIYLINACVDGSKKNESELQELARDDLKGLKNFLNNYVKPQYISTDWNYFIDLFETAKIGQLMKHPVLMDGITRFKYFRHISQYIQFDMSEIESVEFTYHDTNSKFNGWNTKITQGSVLHDVYVHGNAYYPKHGHLGLLSFVQKVFDHYNERAKVKNLPACSRDQIERIISAKYPGFLSCIHGIFVKCLSSSSISPK